MKSFKCHYEWREFTDSGELLEMPELLGNYYKTEKEAVADYKDVLNAGKFKSPKTVTLVKLYNVD